MRFTILVFVFGSTFWGYTQDAMFLKGKVISDSVQVESIHILNLTKAFGTISDEAGFFEIKANPGDTIVFSSIKHHQKNHIVEEKDIKLASLEVTLEIKVNELDEVLLSPYNLSGKVREDMDRVKTYESNLPIFNFKELDETPFINEQGAKTIKNPLVVDEMDATPVNFIAVGRMIISLFKKKEGKRSKEVVIPKISDFYNTDFFVKELEIPETDLYNFLEYLNENPKTKEALKSANELYILGYLISQSKVFKEKYAITK